MPSFWVCIAVAGVVAIVLMLYRALSANSVELDRVSPYESIHERAKDASRNGD